MARLELATFRLEVEHAILLRHMDCHFITFWFLLNYGEPKPILEP